MALININVDEGFLPRFSKSFLEYYGPESVFVFAVSDLFTREVARALDASAKLKSWDSVAFFGSDEAMEALSQFVLLIPKCKQTLLQEAAGDIGAGSFDRLASESIGVQNFQSWMKAFQSSDFATTGEIINAWKGN
jgi:hypothetical protein